MYVCVLSFRISIHTQHSQRSRTFDLHSFESRHAAAELGETSQTQRGHPGLRGYLWTAAWWRSDITLFIFFLTFDISELWIHINVHSSHNCNNQKQPLFFSVLVKTLFLMSLQEIFVPSRWMATLQLLWLCLTWQKTCHTNSKFKPRPRRALDQNEKASSPSNPKMEVCWTLQQCDRERVIW